MGNSEAPHRAPNVVAATSILGLLLCVSGATVAAEPPARQQQQPPGFGARIARVRVDAIVTDSDGRFVDDLTIEDFELREDGRLQEIVDVQLVDMAAGTVTRLPVGPEATGNAPASRGVAAASVAPDDLGALFFVIDGQSLSPRGKRRFANAWDGLLEASGELPIPRAVYLIDAVGNMVPLSALTHDVDTLQAAADALLAAPTFGTSIHTRLRRLQSDMQNDFDVSNLVRAEEQDELVRSLATFETLAEFCDALASRPGRTAIVWVSTGVKLMEGGPFAVLASRDTFEQLVPDRRIQAAQRRLHEAANSANVSIYAIDPTLRTEEDQFGRNVETATIADSNQLRAHDMQASLDGMRDSMRNAAQETGGQSFVHAADVGGVLATIREDTLRYYLLSYAAPRAQGDGRYHAIDVDVARQGVRVRARQGYVDWPDEERWARTLTAALEFPETVGGVPVEARTYRRFRADGTPITQLVAGVERPVARALGDPSMPSDADDALDFYLLVVRGAEVVDETRTTVRSLNGSAVDAGAGRRFVYTRELDLEPGSYRMSLVARAPAGDELAATRLELDVGAAEGGWQTGDLVLFSGDGGSPMRPVAGRRVDAGDVVTAYLEVAGGRQPSMSVSVLSADGDRRVARAPFVPMQGFGSPVLRGMLQLRGLGAGDYVVEVEVSDPPAGAAALRVPLEVVDRSPRSTAAEGLFGPTAGDAPATTSPALGRLLARLDRLAAIHAGDGLRFTARETIVETARGHIDTAAGSEARAVVRRVDEFEVSRGAVDLGTVTGSRRPVGRDAADADDPLDGFTFPDHLEVAFSWPQLFAARGGQPLHRFEIAGDDTGLGRPATLLAFRPIAGTAEAGAGVDSGWFGTAWIDAESSQILRVHALTAADYAEKIRLAAALADGEAGREFAFTEITTDFWEEVNGLRLPGQVTIVHNRYRVTGNVAAPLETTTGVEVSQTFIDYEFSALPSAQEIRSIVLGPGR